MSTKSTKILIVDDSDVVRNLLVRLVREYAAVLTAENGAEALGLIESGERFDIIISDIEMPEMDGFKFIEAAKASGRLNMEKTTVVFSTGSPNEERMEKARKIGAYFIAKPYDPSQIRALLPAV